MCYLLDCNVLSEQIKPKPDAGLMNWLLHNEGAAGISELTIAELYKGAFMMPHGSRREKTFAWIADLEEAFGHQMLPVDFDILKRWAQLSGESERHGRRLAVMDSLLGATALVHDLVLVTRNTSDFPDEVSVLNPWKK